VKDGQGTQKWPLDATYYVGAYKNDKRNGRGTYYFQKGDIYTGTFVNNVIQGRGKYWWKDGRVYEGEWVNECMEGKGKMIWTEDVGREYKG